MVSTRPFLVPDSNVPTAPGLRLLHSSRLDRRDARTIGSREIVVSGVNGGRASTLTRGRTVWLTGPARRDAMTRSRSNGRPERCAERVARPPNAGQDGGGPMRRIVLSLALSVAAVVGLASTALAGHLPAYPVGSPAACNAGTERALETAPGNGYGIPMNEGTAAGCHHHTPRTAP